MQAAHVVYDKDVAASAVAVDGAGNVYTAGSSTLTKFDPNGTLLYSKLLNLPGDWYGFAADASGNLVIAGRIASDNLATTAGVASAFAPGNRSCRIFIPKK